MELNELQKLAEQHFNRLNCDVIFATSDGCFFEEKNVSFARSHAQSNGHVLHQIKKSTIDKNPETPTAETTPAKKKKRK